jgi:hypothetical protein
MIASLIVRNALTRAALLVIFAISARSIARADVAVLIPPQVEEGAGADIGDQAVQELTRLLKVQGFDVISAGQAAPAAEAEQQRGAFPKAYDPLHCLTPECANEYRRLFDATFAVQLKLFGKGIRASSLSVTLTESPEAFFSASSPVEGRDVRSAVRVAFERARSKQVEGAGPWLTVQGSPEGATVYLDGMQFGRVPFFKRHIEPGEHRLEVRAEGHAAHLRAISVPAEIDHVERLDVSLTAAAAPLAVSHGPSSRARVERRSRWDWLLGGAVLAVGAAHMTIGVLQKTKDGECAQQTSGRCTEYYGDRRGMSRDNALIGFGAASVGIGALVIGVGPVGRLRLRGGSDHASLHLTREF